MFVSQVFVWFVLYSVVGWVWESTYCTIVEHKWQNRGFLYGPVCPIYGVGIVGIMLLWYVQTSSGVTPPWYQVFLVTMVGSAILEYFTHWALEKLFHAYWWDYSNMPLNLNGRICLPASVFFGLGGLLVIYVFYDFTTQAIASADPLLTEAFSLVVMAVIAADTAITASSLASVARAASAINESLNAHMGQFVDDVEVKRAAAKVEYEERKAETESQLQMAAEKVRARRDEAKEERRRRAEAAAQERERFAARLRQTQLGQMGTLTRSAMQRAMGMVSPDELPDSPQREQLAALWRDMLEK